jgi:hypothetical protein
MDAVVTTPPVKKSWRRLILTLLAFVLIPLIPSQLQLVLPIIETPMLLVSIVAACAVVGWLAGEKPMLAVIWVALAVWFLAVPSGPAGTPYSAMVRGWALLLAGSFGLVNLWNSATPFIVRALGALGLAVGLAFIIAMTSPGGLDRYEKVAGSEFARRSTNMLSLLEERTQSKQYRDAAAKSPELDQLFDDLETQVKSIPAGSTIVFPALIALESLAGLALGWAVYTRMSPKRIGPSLGRLREFRFSDQLVWGVAVGATLMMLPPFREGRNAGVNLLVFFGTLYLLRGFGVMAWMTTGRRKMLVIAFVTAFVLSLVAPNVGSLILAALIQLTLGAAMVLGLGDTWLDWRSRPAAG